MSDLFLLCLPMFHKQDARLNLGFVPEFLNLLKKLRKRDKMRGLPSILSFFRIKLNINSITQEHEC